MRLFLGAKISPATTALIKEWKKIHAELPVRWIAEKNLHITLMPPGNAENANSAIATLQSLRDSLHPAVFEFIAFRSVEKPKQAAMIWLSGNVTPSLLSLKNKLTNGFGKKDAHRTFQPHITIAKFQKPAREPANSIFEPKEGVEMISCIQLFHSHLNADGADYEVLHEIKIAQ